MNKTLLTVAIILILWMIYHRNDDYKLNKRKKMSKPWSFHQLRSTPNVLIAGP